VVGWNGIGMVDVVVERWRGEGGWESGMSNDSTTTEKSRAHTQNKAEEEAAATATAATATAEGKKFQMEILN